MRACPFRSSAAVLSFAALLAVPVATPRGSAHAQPAASLPGGRPDTVARDTAAAELAATVAVPASAAAPTASVAAAASTPGVDSARTHVALPSPPRRGGFSPGAVRAPVRGPLSGGEGPKVLHVQVLLGAAGFSPGVLDGRWQGGTRAAVQAFREAHGLGAGDVVDEATYGRLLEQAHRRPAVVGYTLTARDVHGPLRRIPESYAAKARMDCMCYETVAERLAERFHTTPDVLRRLNPEVDLERAEPGTSLTVPNAWRVPPRAAPARLVIDKAGGTLRGYDSTGTLLFSMRASVGSEKTPSPHGRLRVLSVTQNPWYQYNPRVLSGRASAPGRVQDIPPGPNSPVGLVWIQLSRSHVGIHGTPSPEKVGRAQSHGCVRLTNWDALYLAEHVGPGVVVDFV